MSNEKKKSKIHQEIEDFLNNHPRVCKSASKDIVLSGLASCEYSGDSKTVCLTCPYYKLGNKCKDQLLNDALFVMLEDQETIADLAMGHAKAISSALLRFYARVSERHPDSEDLLMILYRELFDFM